MKLRQLTVVVIGLHIIGLILYDIYVVIYGQHGDTVSEVVNDWAYQTNPLLLVGFGSIVGGLVVHFFRWKPNNYQLPQQKIYEVCILENKNCWIIYGTNLSNKTDIASTIYEELDIGELKEEVVKFAKVTTLSNIA